LFFDASFDIFIADLETARNILPQRLQTGPAKRNDLKTIEHNYFYRTNQSTIYKIITQSIQDSWL
jgi:hypothetical protein